MNIRDLILLSEINLIWMIWLESLKLESAVFHLWWKLNFILSIRWNGIFVFNNHSLRRWYNMWCFLLVFILVWHWNEFGAVRVAFSKWQPKESIAISLFNDFGAAKCQHARKHVNTTKMDLQISFCHQRIIAAAGDCWALNALELGS